MSSEHPTLRSARTALRALSLLTPRDERERWLGEWDAEFVHRWSSGRPLTALRTFRRLVAALRDTLHVRKLRIRPRESKVGPPRSPVEPPAHERSPMQDIAQDIRFGLRTLRKAPLFTLVSVATLGLGIGVGVAVFGIVNTAMVQPLPFPDSHRLVMGRATFDGRLNPWASGPDYNDYRVQAGVFENLAAFLPFPVDYTITGDVEPERVRGTTASVNLWATLRVRPQRGRTFTEEEGLAGATDVVMISHGFWQRRFGGSGGVVGEPIVINGNPFTIVGILPSGFHFMTGADVWLPMRPDRDAVWQRQSHNWLMAGRLAEGVTLEEAQSRVDVISAQLQEAYPRTNAGKALLLTDLKEVLLEDYRVRLLVLTGAVALVLLIACGNVTGMLLARAPARCRELSVRAALGAGRARITRQLLIESLILGLAGGAVGVLIALGSRGVILDSLQMTRLGIRPGALSIPMLLGALGLSVGTGLLAGIYPAVRGALGNLARELKEGARNTGGGGTRFRSTLVTAQVAVSIILLVGAGLLLKSLVLMKAVHPGFDTEDMLTFEVELPPGDYPDRADRDRFHAALQARLHGLPGVRSVAMTSNLPIRHFGNIFRVTVPGAEGDGIRTFLRGIRPGYFGAMGIPLQAGRDFLPGGDAPGAAIASESFARSAYPNENPLGKPLQVVIFGAPITLEIVGVVGDVHLTSLEQDPEDALYLPYGIFATTRMGFGLRTDVPPTSLAGAVREEVRRLDGNVPVVGLSTMERDIANSVADRSIVVLALSIYALLPLLLAGVGLYGVVAYYVAQRVHEIGIRMALGADSRRVGSLILRRGAMLAGVGMATGLLGAFALARVIRGMLFGIAPTDPGTYAAVAAFVFLVTVSACAVPTWRAVRSDPNVALRAM